MIPNLKKISLAVLMAVSPALAPMPLLAASGETNAQDSNDSEVGSKQKSGWGNLLPLPIFITEPAIGIGLGATLIYFHKDDDQADGQEPSMSTPGEIKQIGERSKPPPTATAIFAFKTDNDTAGAGAGHSHSFANDRYRLRAAGARAQINSDIYLGDTPIGFQLEGDLLFADLKTRLGGSSVFLGLSNSYLKASNKFIVNSDKINDSDFLNFDFTDVGLAASLTYDTRDNTILPNRGLHAELIAWHHDESLGGDFNYSLARLTGLWYTPIGENFVLGARIDSSVKSGDPPFYAFPYVRLRGIPALRYQGELASTAELEGRRRIGDRWSVSLFAGAGTVRIGNQQVETDDEIRSVGVGARWLAFRKEDAWVGLDVARGPEKVAVYIQMGSSW